MIKSRKKTSTHRVLTLRMRGLFEWSRTKAHDCIGRISPPLECNRYGSRPVRGLSELLKGRGTCHHDDKSPSLSITQRDRVLVYCHSGCTQEEVISALCNRGLWYETTRKAPAFSESELDESMFFCVI